MKDIDKQLTLWTWIYDMILWIFTIVFDLFFREITPRGAYRIPKNGPVIFVGAPHANQFVDPMILMQLARREAGRRISFLIAEHSTKRRFINLFSKATSAIGVARAQDNLKPGTGTISLDNSNPLKIIGNGTKFTEECMVRGLIGLPKGCGNGEIVEIINDTELTIRKEFKSNRAIDMLKQSTSFKVAEHINQSSMYNKVFTHLNHGGCIGIYPEGGSHDRTDLLPLKAGVAIMALGAIADNPDCNLKIVPCGMNYFHAHKFRSRAVIEFGSPMEIPKEMVEKYKSGGDDKREAVKKTLDMISQGLKLVTVTCQDYDTLMVIQAARRLYHPAGKKLPLSMVVELNRRLLKGYDHYKDDPSIIHLRENVTEYNRQLKALNIKDHQVENASLSPQHVVGKLIFRSCKLLLYLIGSLPGLVLFSPVFVLTKTISRKKAKEALAGSTVKIAARDVLATWKLLVALAAAPILYTFYALLAAIIAWKYEFVNGWLDIIGVIFLSFIILPLTSYAALAIGETGMDIFKSLKPLLLALNPAHKNSVENLQQKRRQLVAEVTELVNSLGPELFPDFGKIAGWRPSENLDTKEQEDDLAQEAKQATLKQRRHERRRSSGVSSEYSTESNSISRVNSESELANMPLFSSATYKGSETPDLPVGTTTATSQKQFQSEVSRRIMESRSKRDD